MPISPTFSHPLLIYDDNCSSCEKFAKSVSTLSRGQIRTAGHHHSKAAIEAKKLVFPTGYDPTSMFWLINQDGAYGGRAGLLPVAKEILRGIFKGVKQENEDNYIVVCNYNTQRSCTSTMGIIKRMINMMQSSSKFHFHTKA